jgi:hypothetical protein
LTALPVPVPMSRLIQNRTDLISVTHTVLLPHTPPVNYLWFFIEYGDNFTGKRWPKIIQPFLNLEVIVLFHSINCLLERPIHLCWHVVKVLFIGKFSIFYIIDKFAYCFFDVARQVEIPLGEFFRKGLK